MKRFGRAALPLILVSVATAVTAVTAAVAGTVTVAFVDAPRYADAGATPWEREANLKVLTQHLQRLGERHLPEGQTLAVEVLDVDLAGTLRPSRRAGADLRVVKGGADWPRIHLRYSLAVPGQPARAGEESLADMNYTRGMAGARASEPLRYEKQLLDSWFKARFVEGQSAAN